MSTFLIAIILSLVAGFAAFGGALLAKFESIQSQWLEQEFRHGIMAFGGGALLAAVSLVLLPEGQDKIGSEWIGIIFFFFGALFFMGIDRYLAQKGSSMSQTLAMMLDYIPETIVLGAIITDHFKEAVFLAVIMAAQNLPEGFNAYREMSEDSKKAPRTILTVIFIAACTGPLWIMIGMFIFADHSPHLGMLMTFCAGGILYLIFNDIAPQAKLENYWLPSFGAILGFMVGMVGQALI